MVIDENVEISIKMDFFSENLEIFMIRNAASVELECCLKWKDIQNAMKKLELYKVANVEKLQKIFPFLFGERITDLMNKKMEFSISVQASRNRQEALLKSLNPIFEISSFDFYDGRFWFGMMS